MELGSDVARISNQGLQGGLKSPGGACTSLNKVCYYVEMYLDVFLRNVFPKLSMYNIVQCRLFNF